MNIHRVPRVNENVSREKEKKESDFPFVSKRRCGLNEAYSMYVYIYKKYLYFRRQLMFITVYT